MRRTAACSSPSLGVLSCSGAGRRTPSASPLPPLAGTTRRGCRRCPRSRRATRATRSTRGSTPRRTARGSPVLEWRNIGDARVELPLPPLLERVPQQPLDGARGEGRRAPDAARTHEPRLDRLKSLRGCRGQRAAGWQRDGPRPRKTSRPPCATCTRTATTTTARWSRSPAHGRWRRARRRASAIEWESLVPYGTVGRAGWVHDYHFIAQWFPKIGVLTRRRLERAPVLRLDGVLLGLRRLRRAADAAARLRGGRHRPAQERRENADGTQTLRFVQEDVHDFAWIASRRFLERQARFEDPGYPPVDIRLLLQPEHEHLATRYLEATKIALRTTAPGRRPTPTRRSRWSTRRGARPRAAWSTRRCSPAARSVLAPPRAAQPRGRHDPRGGPPVLVRPGGQQRVRGGLARRGLQHLHDREGDRALARRRPLEPPLLRRRPTAAARRGGWPFVAPSRARPARRGQSGRPARRAARRT